MKVFVTGIDTGVGKTEICQSILRMAISDGLKPFAIKPIETGMEELKMSGQKSDHEKLKESADGSACSIYQFQRPASPWQAALQEERTIEPKVLIEAIRKESSNHDFVLVEGAGGWHVPITESYMISDLAKDLGWPVVLVSSNRLGAVNHTLLSCESLKASGLKYAVVVNEFEKLDEGAKTTSQLKKLINTRVWVHSRGESNNEFWNEFKSWAI